MRYLQLKALQQEMLTEAVFESPNALPAKFALPAQLETATRAAAQALVAAQVAAPQAPP